MSIEWDPSAQQWHLSNDQLSVILAVRESGEWRDASDTLVRRNALVRGGDDLMAAGIFLDDATREAGSRGDFQARLFAIEAV